MKEKSEVKMNIPEIELSPTEVLNAIVLWIRENKPGLAKQYTTLTGNIPALKFQLHNRREEKEKDIVVPGLKRSELSRSIKRSKRLIRVNDDLNEKEE